MLAVKCQCARIAYQCSNPVGLEQLPEKLKRLGVPNWLNVTLEVSAPSKDGYGMNGSGLFIINPPWSLEKTLRETLPKLTEILAQGVGHGDRELGVQPMADDVAILGEQRHQVRHGLGQQQRSG